MNINYSFDEIKFWLTQIKKYSFGEKIPAKFIFSIICLVSVIYLAIKNIDFINILLSQLFNQLKTEKQTSFSVIAWLLSILIFIYNNRKANERESRKEAKSDIDFIIKSLEDVIIIHKKMRENQNGVNTNFIEEDTARIDIVAKITRINIKMENITPNPLLIIIRRSFSELKEFIIMVNLSRKIGEVYDISTMDHSEYANNPSGEKVIFNNTLTITKNLENLFYKKYKNQRFG